MAEPSTNNMDLGRRPKLVTDKMLVNLEHGDQSWFFCNFKLETILDILDRGGGGVREEDQWRLADKRPLTDGLSSKLWQNVSDDSLMEH